MATLRQGSTGQDVRDLQTALSALGYSISIDGDYGPGTAAVVRQFQSDHSLSADGIAGPATQNLIRDLISGPSSTVEMDPEVITADPPSTGGGGSISSPVLIAGAPDWLLPVGLGILALVGLAVALKDKPKKRRYHGYRRHSRHKHR